MNFEQSAFASAYKILDSICICLSAGTYFITLIFFYKQPLYKQPSTQVIYQQATEYSAPLSISNWRHNFIFSSMILKWSWIWIWSFFQKKNCQNLDLRAIFQSQFYYMLDLILLPFTWVVHVAYGFR